VTDELVPSISSLITDNDIDVQSAAIRLVTELHMPAFKETSLQHSRALMTLCCSPNFAKHWANRQSQTLLILASRLGEAKPVSVS